MKFKGKKLEGPKRVIMPIIRDGQEDVVFIIEAVVDMTPFFNICPQPIPRLLTLPGGAKKIDPDDRNFEQELDRWARRRIDWMNWQSLRNSPDITWDTIDSNNPDTWGNWEKEMRESGLTDIEITRIFNAMAEVNSLNEDKIEEARQRFLAGELGRQREQNSPMAVPFNIASGELVNGADSPSLDMKEQPVGSN